MKRIILALTIFLSSFAMFSPADAIAYNFGDFRSVTLTAKAWEALGRDDIEAVLAFTNKCVELYGEQAKEMQKSLNAYPEGSNDTIFTYWALNDVATNLFIQAEAYRKAGMNDEAKEAYVTIINDYSFGQTWDPNGWFWKPGVAAEEKLKMMSSGTGIDYGDYTSSHLTTQAWRALANDNPEAVVAYVDKVLELYGEEAKTMQDSLTEYVWESKEKIIEYWALNDVGTALFVKGEAYKKAGNPEEAKRAYKQLVDEYYYAQCWDPNGWFWKPSDAAQEALDGLGEI